MCNEINKNKLKNESMLENLNHNIYLHKEFEIQKYNL